MSEVAEIDISLALAAAAGHSLASGPSRAPRQRALAMITEEGLARPAFCYLDCQVSGVRGARLELGTTTLEVPGMAGISSRLTAVTALACTLGPALEARVSGLCSQRSMSLALALDELGNAMLMYAARFAALAIRKEARSRGLTTGDTLTPGGPGLALADQAAVLALAGGDRLGITVNGQGMLSPVKSRSLIVGLGMGLSAQPARRRCEVCSSGAHCSYRRRTTRGGRLCPS